MPARWACWPASKNASPPPASSFTSQRWAPRGYRADPATGSAASGPVLRVRVLGQRPAVRRHAVHRGRLRRRAYPGHGVAVGGSSGPRHPRSRPPGHGAACACVRDAMAAVFTMSTATITLRTAVVPRWTGMLGFAVAVAVVLLVSVGPSPWVKPPFPAWILLLSIDILRTGLRVSRHHQAPGRRDRVGHGPDASASRLPTAASSAPGRHLEPPSRQRRRGRRRQAHATRVCLSGFLRESITRPSPR